MNKKFLIGITIIVILVVVLIILLGIKEKEPKIINIGAILPLTGDAAQWGIPPRNGAQLAVDEINVKDGVAGKKLVLIIEDTRCEPKEGVSAFNKLLSENKLNIILGGVCSSVTLAVAPIANRNHILLISPASTNPKITTAGDFIFRVIPSDDLRGRIFAEYLFNDIEVMKVALLYINNEGGVGNKESFKKRFTQLGGHVLIEEAYAQNATDLRLQLTKIKSLEAEVVVVSYLRDAVLVMKQAEELKVGKPLYFQTEAVEDPNVLREAGTASEGVTYILPASAEGEIVDKFTKLYEQKYEKKPELFAAEAYDIIHLIASAIEAHSEKAISAELIRDYLYSVKDYAGASGTISFDENGDVLKPMAIKKIFNGKPKTLTIK